MDTPRRYAVTFPGPPGGHGPPQVVIVYPTGDLTPAGAVYADEAGTLRVVIEGGAARPLAAPPGPGHHTCLHALPLP
ncbi:DUF6296 family protein [Kitasatospora sp. NPDC056076]|uniref:DUF6296 family protein n=1 Tax=Kitasatospora sp. NPDC056076 TaxID=3345703 RepID=UPI0035D654E5